MDQQQPNSIPDAAPARPEPSGTPMSGSIRLFRVFGVDVYLHFTWILLAIYAFWFRQHEYQSRFWNALEFIALFGIVLLHEFGHALACRSVGGVANRIMLWPLGGVAFVQPPQRAGAMLWSIAAGPLVNVILIPVIYGVRVVAGQAGLAYSHPDLLHFIDMIAFLNRCLLIFNILPLYPMDGGQILRSLLWFVVGRADSLLIASIIGMIGIIGMAVFFLAFGAGPLAILVVVFLGLQCFQGIRQARILAKLEALPRHAHVRCPACGAHPPMAPVWPCELCRFPSDLIAHDGRCPHCGQVQRTIACPDCQSISPTAAWGLSPAAAARMPGYYGPPGWAPPSPFPAPPSQAKPWPRS